MASTYTALNVAQPAGSQTGPNFATSANANDVALWYYVVMGGNAPTFVFSKSGGTTEEPSVYLWVSTAQEVRATNTWTGGYITQQVWEVSQDTGATWATVCTQTYTYDATTGALTATTASGGMGSMVNYAIGRLKATRVLYDAHVAATGAAVHGLGTMSTQAANAVAITGGTASLTYEREAKVAKCSITGSTALDWATAGLFTLTTTGTGATLTHTNLPSGVVGYITVDATITTAPTSLFTGVKWAGGSVPTFSAGTRAVVTLMCHDGATVNGSALTAMA